MNRLVVGIAVLLALVLVSSASAHVERPSYWPDPAADTSITPATGGKVPKAALARVRAEAEALRATRASCASAAR